ncbi:hypothetical protein [Bacillus sp. BF9-10]|uniref:hypothetical protein n=1 Tax=Bacillus sp. BF9-10 TaxID=2217822 RepID=UPI0011C9D85C|nr:hypothetical protein [Bacillus sp. BF9-10]TXR78299.1 hypothetical protein DN396_19715 [Bacillus sp. BF9-10]
MNEDLLFILDILGEIQEKLDVQGVNLDGINQEVEGLQGYRKRMEEKIDNIGKKLSDLLINFDELKTETRGFEEKIVLMNLKLERIEQHIDAEDLEDYYLLSQSNYCNWDMLDDLTQKFIPIAEYLFSKLQKLSDADYSPVILELCRAIENEFLVKIFRKYTLDLINRQGENIHRFLVDDSRSNTTWVFAKVVKKAIRTQKPEYTLGQMNTILSLLKQADVLSGSPLLHDFENYISTEYDSRNLLSTAYMAKISQIVSDYRNPSAHPEYMDFEKAKECKDIMPERIDYLIDCLMV